MKKSINVLLILFVFTWIFYMDCRITGHFNNDILWRDGYCKIEAYDFAEFFGMVRVYFEKGKPAVYIPADKILFIEYKSEK